MRLLIRYFFKTIRIILGPFILLLHALTLPKGMQRSEEEQRRVDLETKALTLYQFKTCPFCLIVKRKIRRLSLKIETRDAQFDQEARKELREQGGMVKVPCLKITDAHGQTTWMYESSIINQYLEQRFAG
jgi:glutaredoxin